MKKIIILLLLSFIPLTSNARVDCSGKVTRLLEWSELRCKTTGPDGFVSNHFAYQLSSIGNRWICSTSDTGDALIMLAFTNNRNVISRIPSGSACTEAGVEHYSNHEYSIIY